MKSKSTVRSSMKPGDLVSLRFTLIQPEGRIGVIIKEIINYDHSLFQVLWSNGEVLVEESVDLEIVDETR